MTFYSRADWGARPYKGTPTYVPPSDRKRFVAHYSTGQELGVEDCAQWVRNIQKFHQDGRGWDDIGYNFLVCKHGDVWEGRGWTVQGAHAPGANRDGYGVCFLGNDDPGVEDVTPEARASFRAMYSEAVKRSGSLAAIGHRDVKSTACPGDELYTWIKAGLPVTSGAPVRTEPVLAPPPKPARPPVLRRGDKGPAVVELQKQLLALGWPLPKYGADGDFGAETEHAVRLLQTAARITVDGIVGPQTRAAIAQGVRPAPKPAAPHVPLFPGNTRRGSTGPVVVTVQRRLREHGLNLAVDGIFGPQTDRAVRLFQRKHGLAADGIVGPKTWKALWS